MENQFNHIRVGLIISMLTLFFGVGMGALFGVNEAGIKDWIKAGVEQHPELHDKKSAHKFWRYAQRSHFHAMGLGAASVALIGIIGMSAMRRKLKTVTAILISLGGLYPLSWFCIFLLGPSIGRDPAYHAFITKLFSHVGVSCLMLGMTILFAHLVFGVAKEGDES